MNDLVKHSTYSGYHIAATSQPLSADYWKARYVALLEQHTWNDLATFATMRNNPYQAVVNATAFCLHWGNFRGYEHFVSVFFNPESKYYLGLSVHKERTRTHIKDGMYVTDWYVEFTDERETHRLEQLYRAAVGMLVTCEIRPSADFVKFTEKAKVYNIRMQEDGHTQAQISSY